MEFSSNVPIQSVGGKQAARAVAPAPSALQSTLGVVNTLASLAGSGLDAASSIQKSNNAAKKAATLEKDILLASEFSKRDTALKNNGGSIPEIEAERAELFQNYQSRAYNTAAFGRAVSASATADPNNYAYTAKRDADVQEGLVINQLAAQDNETLNQLLIANGINQESLGTDDSADNYRQAAAHAIYMKQKAVQQFNASYEATGKMTAVTMKPVTDAFFEKSANDAAYLLSKAQSDIKTDSHSVTKTVNAFKADIDNKIKVAEGELQQDIETKKAEGRPYSSQEVTALQNNLANFKATMTKLKDQLGDEQVSDLVAEGYVNNVGDVSELLQAIQVHNADNPTDQASLKTLGLSKFSTSGLSIEQYSANAQRLFLIANKAATSPEGVYKVPDDLAGGTVSRLVADPVAMRIVREALSSNEYISEKLKSQAVPDATKANTAVAIGNTMQQQIDNGIPVTQAQITELADATVVKNNDGTGFTIRPESFHKHSKMIVGQLDKGVIPDEKSLANYISGSKVLLSDFGDYAKADSGWSEMFARTTFNINPDGTLDVQLPPMSIASVVYDGGSQMGGVGGTSRGAREFQRYKKKLEATVGNYNLVVSGIENKMNDGNTQQPIAQIEARLRASGYNVSMPTQEGEQSDLGLDSNVEVGEGQVAELDVVNKPTTHPESAINLSNPARVLGSASAKVQLERTIQDFKDGAIDVADFVAQVSGFNAAKGTVDDAGRVLIDAAQATGDTVVEGVSSINDVGRKINKFLDDLGVDIVDGVTDFTSAASAAANATVDTAPDITTAANTLVTGLSSAKDSLDAIGMDVVESTQTLGKYIENGVAALAEKAAETGESASVAIKSFMSDAMKSLAEVTNQTSKSPKSQQSSSTNPDFVGALPSGEQSASDITGLTNLEDRASLDLDEENTQLADAEVFDKAYMTANPQLHVKKDADLSDPALRRVLSQRTILNEDGAEMLEAFAKVESGHDHIGSEANDAFTYSYGLLPSTLKSVNISPKDYPNTPEGRAEMAADAYVKYFKPLAAILPKDSNVLTPDQKVAIALAYVNNPSMIKGKGWQSAKKFKRGEFDEMFIENLDVVGAEDEEKNKRKSILGGLANRRATEYNLFARDTIRELDAPTGDYEETALPKIVAVKVAPYGNGGTRITYTFEDGTTKNISSSKPLHSQSKYTTYTGADIGDY